MNSGTLSIEMDDRLGIIRVVGSGSWTPDYADNHFGELRQVIAAVRLRQQDLLVLVDLTAADVQPAATAERISQHTSTLYRAGDRIAVIVGSCLAKMQLRRSVDSSCHEVFISANAASTWLLAYRRSQAA